MTHPLTRPRPLQRLAALAIVAALAGATAAGAAAGERERVVVFAAASLTDAVSALAGRYNRRGGPEVVASFAASSALARQIANGAPADVYLSADRRWMDHLEAAGRIDRASRCDLLRNRLVLVAPAARPLETRIAPGFPLAAALGDGRLVMGEPAHVPAGIYGRQALAALGAWKAVADRVVRAADVRAALALVARGEAAAGIVYATDARLSDRVRVVGTFPAATHDPIVYPAARVAGADGAAAREVFAYLASPEARAVFAEFGFEPDGGCSP